MKKLPLLFLLIGVILVLLWNIEANYGFQWFIVLALFTLMTYTLDGYIKSKVLLIGIYLVQTIVLIFTVFLMLFINPILTTTYSKIMYPLIFIAITGGGVSSLLIFYKKFLNEG